MTVSGQEKEGRGVQSVEVGAKLLAVLTEEAAPMMLKDLAQQAGIAAAQAHAYLVSYRKLGLVEQDAQSGRYRLGPFALELGITRMRGFDPMRMAHEATERLANATKLTVALVVWGAFGPTVVQVEEGGNHIHMNTRPGAVYSITGTVSGRIFATFLPEARTRELIRLEKRNGDFPARVGSPQSLSKKEIDLIRRRGYATMEVPPVPGVNAVSAPVFDDRNQLQFALTLIGIDTLFNSSTYPEYIDQLRRVTEDLSMQLGFSLGARRRNNFENPAQLDSAVDGMHSTE